jgi:hypothetical protein
MSNPAKLDEGSHDYGDEHQSCSSFIILKPPDKTPSGPKTLKCLARSSIDIAMLKVCKHPLLSYKIRAEDVEKQG